VDKSTLANAGAHNQTTATEGNDGYRTGGSEEGHPGAAQSGRSLALIQNRNRPAVRPFLVRSSLALLSAPVRRQIDVRIPADFCGASAGSEDADAYKLSAELPGMNEKEIEVAVTDGMLTLTWAKRQETERKDKDYYLSEREYGSFKRSFALPDSIDIDKISADIAKGVFTITLPKKQEAKAAAKKVEVMAAS